MDEAKKFVNEGTGVSEHLTISDNISKKRNILSILPSNSDSIKIRKQDKKIKRCKCNLNVIQQIAKNPKCVANTGRSYYSCPKSDRNEKCDFFLWADQSGQNTRDTLFNMEEIVPEDIVIYTDGACTGNRDVANTNNPAGFGCVVLAGNIPSSLITN